MSRESCDEGMEYYKCEILYSYWEIRRKHHIAASSYEHAAQKCIKDFVVNFSPSALTDEGLITVNVKKEDSDEERHVVCFTVSSKNNTFNVKRLK